MRTTAIAAVLVAASLVGPATAQAPGGVSVVPNGGAAGGDAMYLNNGDLIGVRNIQGGTLSDQRGSLNLDIAAGSTANPGDVAVNWDVGRDLLIYDGHKRLVARFGASGITFYVRPRVIAMRPRRR